MFPSFFRNDCREKNTKHLLIYILSYNNGTIHDLNHCVVTKILFKEKRDIFYTNLSKMDNPQIFNSVEDECRFWKERAKSYYKE